MSKHGKQTKGPCPKCGSSDGLSTYESGYQHCYVCGHFNYGGQPAERKEVKMATTYSKIEDDFDYREIQTRGLSRETCSLFKYGVFPDKGHKYYRYHVANYYDKSGSIVAQKLRSPGKEFRVIGDSSKVGLFGQSVWPSGGEALIVCEGEIDAMSVSQALGNCRAVVSVPNGAQSAPAAIKAALQYVSSFRKVIFFFDSDEAGQKAASECCKLLPPGKAYTYVARGGLKDANDMLMAGMDKELACIAFRAKEYRPEGVVAPNEIPFADVQRHLERGVPVSAFPKLSEYLRGLQRGGVYTLGAREKSGKSLFCKQIVLGLLQDGVKTGVLFLEEEGPEVLISFAAMMHKVPSWKVREDISLIGGEAGLKEAADKLTEMGLYIYDHKGAFSPQTVVEIVRFLAVGLGCRVIVLDNMSISLASSGGDLTSTNKSIADIVATCRQTECSLLNVVHLKKNRLDKDGNDSVVVNAADIYGSGDFAKFSHALLAIEREPSRTRIRVLRNRTTGVEDKADVLSYNKETGLLEPREEVEPAEKSLEDTYNE